MKSDFALALAFTASAQNPLQDFSVAIHGLSNCPSHTTNPSANLSSSNLQQDSYDGFCYSTHRHLFCQYF